MIIWTSRIHKSQAQQETQSSENKEESDCGRQMSDSLWPITYTHTHVPTTCQHEYIHSHIPHRHIKQEGKRCLGYVFIALKRYHDHGNSYKGKHLTGVAYSSEAQHIPIMVGHSSMQADMVLERQLRVLHLIGKRK